MCHRFDEMNTAWRVVESALPWAEHPPGQEWLLVLSLVKWGWHFPTIRAVGKRNGTVFAQYSSMVLVPTHVSALFLSVP